MNNFLAIDTSSSACSVAVCTSEKIVDEFILAPQDHIRRLLPMIDKLLLASGTQLSDMDAIVFSAGPGSFTGLRICLGTVQGLAFGANIPVIPISTMLACAQTALRCQQLVENTLIIPCFDARMGEVYWGSFETTASQSPLLQRQGDDSVSALTSVISRISELINGRAYEQVRLIGDGWALLSEEQSAAIQAVHHGLSIDTTVYPQARDLPELAREYLKTQSPISALEAEPSYVRNEVSWKKREKIRS